LIRVAGLPKMATTPSKLLARKRDTLAHDEHRARRVADHLVAGATQDQFRDAAHAARAHDNYRASVRPGDINDGLGSRTFDHIGLDFSRDCTEGILRLPENAVGLIQVSIDQLLPVRFAQRGRNAIESYHDAHTVRVHGARQIARLLGGMRRLFGTVYGEQDIVKYAGSFGGVSPQSVYGEVETDSNHARGPPPHGW
jgi:hypothetical protein